MQFTVGHNGPGFEAASSSHSMTGRCFMSSDVCLGSYGDVNAKVSDLPEALADALTGNGRLVQEA